MRIVVVGGREIWRRIVRGCAATPNVEMLVVGRGMTYRLRKDIPGVLVDMTKRGF